MRKFIIIIPLFLVIVNTCIGATINGKVTDNSGAPVENADVYIYGTDKCVKTDSGGNYTILNICPASPRYIVCVEKEGYFVDRKGNIGVKNEEPVNVDFVLEKFNESTSYKAQILDIRLSYLIDHKIIKKEPVQPAEDAVLDLNLYPDSVIPYLGSGKYIDKDNQEIQVLAQEILSSVPESLRTNQTEVAKSVYIWVVKNIDYDLMKTYPGDVTCGNWQTVNGGWGKNFAEWCYLPQEMIIQRRGICIEYERFTSTLLRALNIPARSAPLKAHPVTQWWVQLPDGSGYWANMETSMGHKEYEVGNTYARFPSQPDSKIAFWWPNADAPIHNDWGLENSCLWREVTDGGGARLVHNSFGLSEAKQLLEIFRQRGKIEFKGPLIDVKDPFYEVYSRGFQIDLSTIGNQKRIAAFFPLFIDNKYNTTIDYAFWANHAEWIENIWVETLTDNETLESIPILYIDINLKPVKLIESRLKNPCFEEGSSKPSFWNELPVAMGSTVFSLSNDSKKGNHSACIENLTNGMSAFYQDISIEEGDVIRIDGWIKLENVQGTACIDVIFSGDYGNVIVPRNTYPNLSGTQGWTKFWGTFFAPLGTSTASIRCTLIGKGKAKFDGLKLLLSTRHKRRKIGR